MFDHRVRMMSFVERWNIAPRSYRQSVAEHSYYVILYASTLCYRLNIQDNERLQIMEAAMSHDMAEIRTGDLPGPAKRAVVDRDKLLAYEHSFLLELGCTPHNLTEKGWQIIKAADTIDAYYWCAVECAQGNMMMRYEKDVAYDRMRIALQKLGFKNLHQAIDAEAKKLSEGVYLAPRLDSDL